MSLPYTALDLADLLRLRDLGVKEEAALLDKIWAEEQAFAGSEEKQTKLSAGCGILVAVSSGKTIY